MESFLYEKRHSTKDCVRRYNISVVRPCGGMTELGIGRAQNVSFASLPGFTELAHDVAAANRYFNKDITLPNPRRVKEPFGLAEPSFSG